MNTPLNKLSAEIRQSVTGYTEGSLLARRCNEIADQLDAALADYDDRLEEAEKRNNQIYHSQRESMNQLEATIQQVRELQRYDTDDGYGRPRWYKSDDGDAISYDDLQAILDKQT